MNFRVAFTLVSAAVLTSAAVDAQFRFPPDGHDLIHEREHVRSAVVRHVVEHVGPALSIEQRGDDPCRDAGWDDDYYRTCDVREYTLPGGALTVDAGRNGGIRVEGWDRNEINVQAIVTANARTEEAARQLASEVRVDAGSGRVSSTGPSTERREWWSVSYRINVPRRNDLELHANNGGITIRGVTGNIRFDTTNGGVTLTDLAGDVRGETRNGGLNVTLSGDRWDGAGLEVETSNGGVTLSIPDGYNAELSTRTVNGGFRSDIPMTIQGELSPRRGIQTTLGAGGPPVSVRTTNGGLRINRR
jgi:DUF4097 and DUF4098 domain-containing protein YvlB